jgi:hypothetical protein
MSFRPIHALAFALVLASAASAQTTPDLHNHDALTLRQVKTSDVSYKGKPAIRIDDAAPVDLGDAGRLAVVNNTTFTNGSIDLDVTGDTAPNADPVFRGFVGLAFRVSADASRFECFYLRPKNGHAPDPVQHGHATQYISIPGYPWQKLRKETPGKYETAADIAPGEWIHLHIVVSGQNAKLYVNNAAEPTLLVNDLKQPISAGSLALWIGPGTIAHFANLTYTAAP